MEPNAPAVVILGPCRAAVSGVATHVDLLLDSRLAQEFALTHFQVGSEGHSETGKGRLLRLLTSPFMLAARILKTRADVVHINTSFNCRAYWRDFAYLLAAKLCGARVLYQVHGGPLPRQFAAGGRLGRAVLRATLTLPDAVAVLTRAQCAAYREFVPNQAIVALPNGIDLAPYAGLVRAPADAAAPLRLIYVGRLTREKGLFEALRGLAAARAQGSAATLTVAGGGPDEAQLRALAQRLELDGAVHFPGPVFGADKLALYAQADVLLLPSYAEAMPYALLECMAAGVPAIASCVGGIPDVMVEDVHGLFVAPRDEQAIARAIARLAGDRVLLAAMRENCRRRIAHSYALERLAGELSRIYWELGTGRRAGLLSKRY